MAGVDDGEEPPVPIPNTEVKLACAEDSWLETACENRQMPVSLKKQAAHGPSESPVRGFALLSTISSVGRATDS